jgi:hypothetical protein
MTRVMKSELPREAFYGDGTEIEPDTLQRVRAAIDGATVMFPWRRDDVLLLDNMLVQHGRASYSGERTVLVAMGDPHDPVAARHV